MWFKQRNTQEKIISQMGFSVDQNGIFIRYSRESEEWESHLRNTKNYILKSVADKEKKSIVFLGSGWWLDIPLQEIYSMFENIYMVDILHPKVILHKSQSFSKIQLISADISGVLESVFEATQKFKQTKQKIDLQNLSLQPFDYSFVKENNLSFVVSLNLLNQLDILICDYLISLKIYSESEINAFRSRIQNHHLQQLPKEKSCLISDVEENVFDKNGQLEKTKSLIFCDFSFEKNFEEWMWNFDISGNYNQNKKTIFKVKATQI